MTNIVNKLWGFCHTLRHEGVDYADYIEELTYLLFLKIAEEREIDIPKQLNWYSLTSSSDKILLENYNVILKGLSEQPGMLREIFSEPIAKIHSSSSLRKLLNLIDEVNWSDYDVDVLGATFEGLLEKAASESKKGAGQYFTPRPLIKSIVKVMKPNPFEASNFKLSDVACGTAGFITESFEWYKQSTDISKLSPDNKYKLYNETYYGQELVIRPRRLAMMNLYLHGLRPNIELGDTIYEPRPVELVSCVLTNPPFGTRGASNIPDRDFEIKTTNKQLNFIQHIIQVLEQNGRSAIVLPDSVLTEDKGVELWKELMKFCRVHTILKLPNGTFLPYANVKAIVVFLQKKMKTEELWIYDARTNLPSVTKKTRPLSQSHFDDFVESYGEDPNGNSIRKETDRFKKFDRKDIKDNGYRLDFDWLTNEEEEEPLSQMEPQDIINETITDLEALTDELKDIAQILDEN